MSADPAGDGRGGVHDVRRPALSLVGRPPAWTCDEHTLVVSSDLASLPEAEAIAIEGWLLDHGIDPSAVVRGSRVERDTVGRRVSYVSCSATGRPRLRSFRRLGDPTVEWPSAFPAILLAGNVVAPGGDPSTTPRRPG